MKKIIFLFTFGLIWYILFASMNLDSIPNPIDVITVLLSSEFFNIIDHLLRTLSVFIIVLLVSIVMGYSIGLLAFYNKNISDFIYILLNGIKSVPTTVFLPVFMMVFKLDYYIYPMISTPLIAILGVNIAKSLEEVSENRSHIINSLAIKKSYYFKHILYWETLDTFFATLRILITYALTLEIAFDYFLGTSHGIGDYIRTQYESYDVSTGYVQMYAGIIVASLIGVFLIKILDMISNKVLSWKPKNG